MSLLYLHSTRNVFYFAQLYAVPSLNTNYILNYNFCSSYKNPAVLGCIAGSALMRKAASLAFSNKKRSTVTGDIIECLGKRQRLLEKIETRLFYCDQVELPISSLYSFLQFGSYFPCQFMLSVTSRHLYKTCHVTGMICPSRE